MRVFPTLAPIIHAIRHAQGYHNIALENYFMRDPSLTPEGEHQCAELAKTFPYHSRIELITSSPMRRTIQTALHTFPAQIAKGFVIITLPEAQELSGYPSDTGSDIEMLRKEMKDKPVDLSRVPEGWNSKSGKWAPERIPAEKRARELRTWLKARKEKEIVLVTHGGFLHYFVEDWSEDGEFHGTAWVNTEFRTYEFVDPEGESVSIKETTESRERRRGTERPITKREQEELRNIIWNNSDGKEHKVTSINGYPVSN